MIDAGKLRELEVVQTGDDPDHYAIRPRDPDRLQNWIASRDTEPQNFAEWHPLTREVVSAIIETDMPEDQ